MSKVNNIDWKRNWNIVVLSVVIFFVIYVLVNYGKG